MRPQAVPSVCLNQTTASKYQQLLNYLGNHRILIILAFAASITVMFFYRPFQQMELGDQALYDYCAQVIVRGLLPYRDVVDGKAPGSMYLSALAMTAGKSVGMRDIFAVRLLNVLFVGLLSSLTYVIGSHYLRSRTAALIGSLFPLMFPAYAMMMIAGTQPKLSMILFGMFTLLFIARDKPFWAGLFSMLACLCWQPGLMFTGVAVLIFSKYLTTWRDRRALRVVIGASIPFGVTLLYFYVNAALADLWNWTIVFNYSFYAAKVSRPLDRALSHIWDVTEITCKGHVLYPLIGSAGLLVFLVSRVQQKFTNSERGKSSELFRDALFLIPVIYLAFSLAHFLGDDDLIPLFPFLGLFVGWFLVAMARSLAESRVAKLLLPRLRWVRFAPVSVPLLLLISTYAQVKEHNRDPGISLRYQDAELRLVSDLLGANDKVYVHRCLELLVFLNRTNVSKYVMFDRGKGDFIEAKMPGGLQAVMDDIEAQSPKLLLISHLGQLSPSHRAAIRQWVEGNYESLSLDPKYEQLVPELDHVYIRKPP